MADRRSVFWKPAVSPLRFVPGTHVPAPKGIELVEAMQENVREASLLLDKARAAVDRHVSLRDIVEDTDAEGNRRVLKALTDEAKVALSDLARSRIELAHWNEYMGWARTQAHAGGTDTRLPVEREVGADDGDEAVA